METVQISGGDTREERSGSSKSKRTRRRQEKARTWPLCPGMELEDTSMKGAMGEESGGHYARGKDGPGTHSTGLRMTLYNPFQVLETNMYWRTDAESDSHSEAWRFLEIRLPGQERLW